MGLIYRIYKIQRFLYLHKLGFLAWIIRAFARIIFCSDILYKTEIGKGTYFLHLGMGVMTHQESIIGQNCRIYQYVMLGGKPGEPGKRAPVLGNNVIVYPHAMILGGVHIGDGAIIAAGAIVTKDVPANAIAMGVSAKIVQRGMDTEEYNDI